MNNVQSTVRVYQNTDEKNEQKYNVNQKNLTMAEREELAKKMDEFMKLNMIFRDLNNK